MDPSGTTPACAWSSCAKRLGERSLGVRYGPSSVPSSRPLYVTRTGRGNTPGGAESARLGPRAGIPGVPNAPVWWPRARSAFGPNCVRSEAMSGNEPGRSGIGSGRALARDRGGLNCRRPSLRPGRQASADGRGLSLAMIGQNAKEPGPKARLLRLFGWRLDQPVIAGAVSRWRRRRGCSAAVRLCRSPVTV